MGIAKLFGKCRGTIGRPRTFNKEEALDQALEVFWRKGYEGASICDLTAAMGINPPSLYAAFGNKEALFRQALDRYAETRAGFVREALAKPKAREGIAALLRGTAHSLSDKSSPAGCLLVQGVAGAGDHAQCIREELTTRRAAAQNAIRDRLQRAQAEGELPADADPAALARFFTTVMNGMAIQAAGGASRKELERVADMALHAWPD